MLLWNLYYWLAWPDWLFSNRVGGSQIHGPILSLGRIVLSGGRIVWNMWRFEKLRNSAKLGGNHLIWEILLHSCVWFKISGIPGSWLDSEKLASRVYLLLILLYFLLFNWFWDLVQESSIVSEMDWGSISLTHERLLQFIVLNLRFVAKPLASGQREVEDLPWSATKLDLLVTDGSNPYPWFPARWKWETQIHWTQSSCIWFSNPKGCEQIEIGWPEATQSPSALTSSNEERSDGPGDHHFFTIHI